MSEKEKLLAVASPEEWDCWLSVHADYPIENTDLGNRCLFCEAFGADKLCTGMGAPWDCGQCMPLKYKEKRIACLCWEDWGEKLDAAITRLEAAGIWEVEDEETP